MQGIIKQHPRKIQELGATQAFLQTVDIHLCDLLAVEYESPPCITQYDRTLQSKIKTATMHQNIIGWGNFL
jgi:hypothetical protein